MRRCAGDHHGVPGVIDHGVVIADAADQRTAFEPGRQPQRTGPGQMPLGRNGFRAAQLVVEENAGGDIGPFPDPVGQREEERQRLDQMRRQCGQREFALVQRLAHQTELQLLQVSQAAVEHLRTAAGGARGEVPCLDERHPQAAGGGVQGSAGTHHAAADHHDVELFGA